MADVPPPTKITNPRKYKERKDVLKMKAKGLNQYIKAHKLNCGSRVRGNRELEIGSAEGDCDCGLEQAQKELNVLLNLAWVGLEMRKSQKNYFDRGRNYKDLQDSKKYERDFDKLLVRLRELDGETADVFQRALL